MKAMRMFQSLPPYHGGKRKLLGDIFRHLPLPQEAPTFVDCFLGGGAASLFAKARGFKVICNDVAERSYIVGRALIQNDHVRLDYDDLVRLAMPTEEVGYAERQLTPDVFPSDHARYLDLFMANARSLDGIRRWLALLLVIKYALRLRPMGNFGAKTIMRQAAACLWEEMNPNYVRDLNTRGIPRHPIRLAETIRKQINTGIFSNDHENEAYRSDVFEFLSAIEGDICYMDPPYSGTQSYERSMAPLDDLLRGGSARRKIAPSSFTKEPPEKILPRLFEAADHIPIWVLSYGNRRIDLQGVMELMRKFRPHVEGRAIDYVHCSGLAGEESRHQNQELLVIGRK